MPQGDRLIYQRTLKDGRVLAVNVWRTGHEPLIFASQAAYERTRDEVEKEGAVPKVGGFAAA